MLVSRATRAPWLSSYQPPPSTASATVRLFSYCPIPILLALSRLASPLPTLRFDFLLSRASCLAPTLSRFRVLSVILRLLSLLSVSCFVPWLMPNAALTHSSPGLFLLPHGSTDHVVFSFGRSASHACSAWSNTVFTQNTYLNDVLLTQEGDTSGPSAHGLSSL